ncbi:glycosyltransferase family 8 protein [Mucilaginibacter endophyticus]|uniref:glycosyltransferase family 8 protein n=1 Tax=Mucilaginibacter endophyticus TaxID=2675003 RepID=UPI000E0D3188|nr:glycosyltransferase family 8 protein [Mucilaginibacter endophyticus]
MNVAFCVNKLALIGLGVTLNSLAQNCFRAKSLNIWFLCADLSDVDKSNISHLLEDANYSGSWHFIDFDPVKHFGQLRSLHGDWTPYGRLLLPEILTTEKTVLYLDADLVVDLDVTDLEDFDIGDAAIAAVATGTVEYAIEHKFLIREFNLSPESPYFNSGVLLMNLDVWRRDNIKQACLDVGDKFSSELLAVDQTILNALFSNKFKTLPRRFNCAWYANFERPDLAERMIFHFVGSPKPWDLFAFALHQGYAEWEKYLTRFWASKYRRTTYGDLVRAWNIRRSYGRLIKYKLKTPTSK